MSQDHLADLRQAIAAALDAEARRCEEDDLGDDECYSASIRAYYGAAAFVRMFSIDDFVAREQGQA